MKVVRLLFPIFLLVSFAAAKPTVLKACDPNRFAGINEQVCESINQAHELIDRDHSDAALAILKDLPTDSTVTPDLANLIRGERIRAQRTSALRTERQSGAFATLWASLISKANALVSWLILIVLAALILFVIAQLPKLRSTLPQTLLTFTDQTLEKPSDEGNMALTQEVDRLLNPVQEPASEEFIQEQSTSGGGATFANLQPISGTSSIETALAAAGDVDLGAFKISPKALIQVWKDVFKPRYRYTLQGVLSKTGDTVFAYAQKLDGARQPIAGAVWSASCQGENARDSALRELMAKVKTKLSTAELATGIWQSVDYFQRAMDQCRDDKSFANLSAAQLLLQKSLKYDPVNWTARYNNALFLQMIGSYGDSLQNWSFLREALEHGRARGLPEDKQQLKLLLAKVDYNRALTLARMRKWEELKQALTILESLIDATSGDLKWLAKSALVAALGTRYELLESSIEVLPRAKTEAQSTGDNASSEHAPPEDSEQKNGKSASRMKSALDDTYEKMEAITRELTTSLAETEPTSASLMHATAIARNARGAVLLDRGRSPLLALDDFNAAILLSPDLIDARLNAARAIRMKKNLDWTLQVETLLQAVLSLDPKHRETHFLLGSLYLDEAVDRLHDAAEHFEQADPHSWASFELGGLCLNPDFGVPDPQAALKHFRKSVRLGDAVDIRALRLVRLLLRLVDEQLKAHEASRTETANKTDATEPSPFGLREMLHEAERVTLRIKKRTPRPEDLAKVAVLENRAREIESRLKNTYPATDAHRPV